MLKKQTDTSASKRAINHDLVALGIACAAILMFIGTGSSVLPSILRSWLFGSAGPDNMLVNALLLNIALIIFGLRRYRQLISEIEERTRAENTARELAKTDPLTGCLNRRSVTNATDEMIANCEGKNSAVAFIMLDLDNFKQINDLNGHKVGDLVLQSTAERIRSVLPPDAILARLGGDEFGCVTPFDPDKPDMLDQLAVMLIDRASQPETIKGSLVEVTLSVGIATSDQQLSDDKAPSGDNLMHRADIAMYHAKKHGKNRYFWFESSMEKELRFRNDLETGIRRGIQAGEFIPFYEQQVDLETGELMGFEMLARWRSPDLGLVSPAVFIPVAEEMGVIAALSERLIEQALIDAKSWASKLTLSVNISPIQLRDPWFSQKLLKLLVKHNFPPKRLDIEITESCLHENVGVVKSMITSLKNQGVQISLDDFGTGYSSLTQLRTLPFDRLKIDRSFVGKLNDESQSDKIVNAILSLSDGLDLPVTAEGIEDDRILAALRGKGSMKGQGYHYGKPETAEGVRKRLSALSLLAEDCDSQPVEDSPHEATTDASRNVA